MPEDNTKDRKSTRPYRQSLSILLVIVILAAVGVFILLRPNGGGLPLPGNIKQSVSFPLYAPNRLPSGFSGGASPQSDGNIVTFYYSYNGQQLNVVEQSRPNALPNPAKLRQFNLAIGQGWIADFNGRPAGVVLADSTMITISSNAKLQLDPLTNFMKSLAPAR